MRTRRTTTTALALVLALGASARAQLPDEPSPQRRAEIQTTLAKRRGLKVRQHARAGAERAAIARSAAIRAAEEARVIRENTPVYAAVTRDGKGRIDSTYARMPDGSTSFRTADGYVRDTQVFAQP
jgi:hypothetical protein